MRKLLAVCTVLSLVLISGLTLAAEPTERPFAPVQGGFVESAPMVQRWAPDHLLVQFSAEGMQRASLPDPGDKASGTVSRTGIASLDQIMNDIDVRGLRVAFPAVANKSQASALGTDRWYIFDLAPGADVPAVARRLADDPNLADATPDLIAFPATTPNDAMHSANWGHNNTAQLPGFDWGGSWAHTLAGVGTVGVDANAHAAWSGSQGYGSSDVVIAILDSGVDAGHPDLLQVTGYDSGDGDTNPTDDSSLPGHGTACAGVAAAIADNLIGAAGTAGGSSIMPIKVSNSAGNLLFSAITNGIYYAADNGADIISMSFGAATTTISSTDAAITYAYNAGVTLLAATGNENYGQISYPAYHSRVIGVGAASPDGDRKRSGNSDEVNPGTTPDPNECTIDGERWWGSNYGSVVQDHRGAVDVIAPSILPTTDIQGSAGYDSGDYSSFFNGTSCATPYAAGVCALIKAANPSFTPNQIRTQLVGTAQDVVNIESAVGWDRYAGYGLVDAATAVGAVIPPATQAIFTADDTTGCVPFTVNFSDQSIGTIYTWIWDFGDGNFSANQNPSHEYTAPGVYDVSLAITSPDGDDSIAYQGYIVVSGPPTVSFTASQTFVTAGDNVDFTDTSGGAPYDWVWDFGDGGSAAIQHPSHVFDTPGVYSPKLLATNDCGVDSLTMDFMIIVIFPDAPVAGFSAEPTTGCAPLVVDFSDVSTGSPDTWDWDFGDGVTDTVANPSHTFNAAGSYDVRLIVTGIGGADTLTVAAAVIVDTAVSAAFTVSDTLGASPLDVTFTDASSGNPTSWEWDFGDATSDTVANPTHTYTVAGVYDVTLIVNNSCSVDTLVMTAAVTVSDVSAVGDMTPVRFGLAQNFPNPFNPSTTFRFSLETPGRARLDVFDISGRRIATLVDEDKDAGRHEVVWRPRDLASGMYFSRFTVGGKTETRRVILLK